MGVLGEGGIYKFLYKILYNICIIMGVGDVQNWVGFDSRMWVSLEGMLTLWDEILLTFGVDFRVRIRLFTVEMSRCWYEQVALDDEIM